MLKDQSIGVVIPARNEALSIQKVIGELRELRTDEGQLIDTIVVCDNGSNDLTTELAKQAGSQVVSEPKPGYGRACLCALAALEEIDIILNCAEVEVENADSGTCVTEAKSIIENIFNDSETEKGDTTNY